MAPRRAALSTHACAAVRAARERGLHPVLDVVASDIAAAALYERLGWSLPPTVGQQWEPAWTVTVPATRRPRDLAWQAVTSPRATERPTSR